MNDATAAENSPLGAKFRSVDHHTLVNCACVSLIIVHPVLMQKKTSLHPVLVQKSKQVPAVGVEPTTTRLKVLRSTD